MGWYTDAHVENAKDLYRFLKYTRNLRPEDRERHEKELATLEAKIARMKGRKTWSVKDNT